MDLKSNDWRKSKRSGGNGGDCVEILLVEGGQEPNQA